MVFAGKIGNLGHIYDGGGIACTMEALQCPDGSYVGRTGPDCQFASCPSESSSSASTTTRTLAIGTNATIHTTSIGILSLVEDSRCPTDVVCIQAGTVRVRASIDSYNRDFVFTLSQPQVVGDATITLVSVIPAQKFSTQTVAPGDYRFTFTVSKSPVGGTADTTGHSGIRGAVLLGPTCPVVRNPPDPQCADRPYQTQVSIFSATDPTHPISVMQSDKKGAFAFSVAPGEYVVSAAGGKTLPRCSSVNSTVPPAAYVEANVSCDTGIR